MEEILSLFFRHRRRSSKDIFTSQALYKIRCVNDIVRARDLYDFPGEIFIQPFDAGTNPFAPSHFHKSIHKLLPERQLSFVCVLLRRRAPPRQNRDHVRWMLQNPF